MSLQWISPQSRFVLKRLGRNFDLMTTEAKSRINQMMLALDASIIVGLLVLL